MTVFTRDAIGLAPAKSNITVLPDDDDDKPYGYADRIGVTVHWTGSGGKLFLPDQLARLRGIQRYHLNNGYSDIAYHDGFDADGNIYALRSHKHIGGHAKSKLNVANERTLGLVFLEDGRGFTEKAAQTMLGYLYYLFPLEFGHDPFVWDHNDWQSFGGTSTQCAGPEINAALDFWRALKRAA